MREVTQKVYSIKELEAKAKEVALTKLREIHDNDVSFVVEDWTDILNAFGFQDTDIFYSVSWSQGDGASFTAARWEYPKGLVAKIASEYPNIKYLNELAKLTTEMFKGAGYSAIFQVTRTSYRYSHENTVSTEKHPYSTEINDRAMLSAKHLVQSICRSIYADLRKELEYQSTEEYLTEFAQANDYEFLQDGSIFKECL